MWSWEVVVAPDFEMGHLNSGVHEPGANRNETDMTSTIRFQTYSPQFFILATRVPPHRIDAQLLFGTSARDSEVEMRKNNKLSGPNRNRTAFEVDSVDG